MFFVEPRIDMGMPYLREPWVNPFSINIIDTLRKSSHSKEFEFCITLNEPLKIKYESIEGITKIFFTQEELLPSLIGDALVISASWYNEDYSEEQMSYYKNLMNEKFYDFIPDVIITFSPAPYLRNIFPDALVLHHEVSFFSRAPYPMTWYLDPHGMMFSNFSSLKRFEKEIKRMGLNNFQQRLLNNFKQKCQILLKARSPFDAIIKPQMKRFDYLALFPLTTIDTYCFYGKFKDKFKNQYQYLVYVLENIPQNIGLIVTTHTDFVNSLAREVIEYLKLKYPNFIYHEEFEKYYAPSQYLLSYVDVVIGVFSSLCWQSLLWDKKFINLGNLNIIADSNNLEDISGVLQKEFVNKDSILYWLLTRYTITGEYFHDPEWLSNHLFTSLQKFRDGGRNFNFFEPIDNDKNIFDNLANGLDEDIPHNNSVMSYRRQKKSYEDLKVNYEGLKSKCEGLNAFQLLDEMVNNGVDLFAQGKQNEAYTLFSKMLQGVNNIKSVLMNNMAIFHINNGNFDNAEQIFNALINEGSNIDAVRENLQKLQYLKQKRIQTTSFAGENQK
ncbi:MAG: tetratricopeptide repeat protein [Planctomycetia bacterium]|nr:tetratricopeptide repeat protein [Planctomycetia bacterium]